MSVKDAFEPNDLAADLRTLDKILNDSVAAIPEFTWNRPNSRGAKHWTLHQTLSHVTTIAELFHDAMQHALAGEIFLIKGLTSRNDLNAFNRQRIAAEQGIAPENLRRRLSHVLQQTADKLPTLSAEQLTMSVTIPAYNRPLTVAEVAGAQLAHAGIIHAAQMVENIDLEPLWKCFSPEMHYRQLTRLFNIISHAYIPARGGKLNTTIQLRVRGFGKWYMTVNPQGGDTGEGSTSATTLWFWFANPEATYELFTAQMPAGEMIFRRRVFIWGNVFLALRMPYLFNP